MVYQNLLFDADDTLFDFPRASRRAFSRMCAGQGVLDTEENHQLYHEINQGLWGAFDRGETTKEALAIERYVRFFRTLDLHADPGQANAAYETALGEGVFPIPHAETVCRTLGDRGYHLYIVTNAMASVQRRRLRGSVFASLIREAFISEEAGASKPDRAYFDYVLSRIPGANPSNTLVIGDSLSTDIQGANNAGLPCCWYNPKGAPRPEGLEVNHEIRDLRELLELL